MKKTKGFMMMEMIIVIIIIGILAALLLPALSSVSHKAKQQKCKANLKQMGTGLMIYVQDYGRNVRYPDTNGGGFLARLYYTRILSEDKIYLCPGTGDMTDGKLLNELGNAENGEDGAYNAISYAGRKNKNQREYPGIFKVYKDTTLTPVGADDWQEDDNHEDRGVLTNTLYLDGHVDHMRERDRDYQEIMDPLTN